MTEEHLVSRGSVTQLAGSKNHAVFVRALNFLSVSVSMSMPCCLCWRLTHTVG